VHASDRGCRPICARPEARGSLHAFADQDVAGAFLRPPDEDRTALDDPRRGPLQEALQKSPAKVPCKGPYAGDGRALAELKKGRAVPKRPHAATATAPSRAA
jgi:hypothetical protein